LARWTIIQPPASIAQANHEVSAIEAGPVVSAEDSMAPHATRFTTGFAGLGHLQIHRCTVVFVSLDGHRFYAVSPAFEGCFIKVAGTVIRMYASSVKDFRTQIIAQASKTPLVKHQGGRFLSVDGFGFEVNQEVVLPHRFIEHVRSKTSEKRVGVFFWRW
tara:strand:+ start:731 stop:1210 length:480 start_codon:yes stop_codon:yes gene_type:complete